MFSFEGGRLLLLLRRPGSLRISKLHFWPKNIIFLFSCKFFSNFGHQSHESGSGSALVLNAWSALKLIRIWNTTEMYIPVLRVVYRSCSRFTWPYKEIHLQNWMQKLSFINFPIVLSFSLHNRAQYPNCGWAQKHRVLKLNVQPFAGSGSSCY